MGFQPSPTFSAFAFSIILTTFWLGDAFQLGWKRISCSRRFSLILLWVWRTEKEALHRHEQSTNGSTIDWKVEAVIGFMISLWRLKTERSNWSDLEDLLRISLLWKYERKGWFSPDRVREMGTDNSVGICSPPRKSIKARSDIAFNTKQHKATRPVGFSLKRISAWQSDAMLYTFP